jgi:carbamoyl-phosphate synthase large subunit
MKSLRGDPAIELLAADMDPWAAGLYLVPSPDRLVVPAGSAAGFAKTMLDICASRQVDVLLPTVDAELEPLAAARDDFSAGGTELLLASAATLSVTLDKLALARHCAAAVLVPRTELFSPRFDPGSWAYPVIVKPRRGSGSRGVRRIDSAAALGAVGRSDDLIVQEFLPGTEYSIDVLADAAGHVVASVPRIRIRVDSGVSVAGRTVRDPELERFGSEVASAIGLTFVANVQCKRDRGDRPALLEVNPRIPGTLGLTIASGVDMPRLALDSLRGRPLPAQIGFREMAVVRFLDERILKIPETVPSLWARVPPELTPPER